MMECTQSVPHNSGHANFRTWYSSNLAIFCNFNHLGGKGDMMYMIKCMIDK